MKTKPALLLLTSFYLCSCVTTKTYSTEERKMRDPDAGIYVLTTRDKKITGKKITHFYSSKEDQAYTRIDDINIKNEEVKAFQDNKAYYVVFHKKDGYHWVKQIKRGAINLYYYETTSLSGPSGGSSYSDHFVFEKPSAHLELAELSIPDIASILKDNQRAYEKFTSRFGSTDKKFLPKQLDKAPQVLFEAIDIYNGNK